MCACVEILSGFSVDLLTNFSFITNIKHFKGWNLITNICMHKHLCSLHTFYFFVYCIPGNFHKFRISWLCCESVAMAQLSSCPRGTPKHFFNCIFCKNLATQKFPSIQHNNSPPSCTLEYLKSFCSPFLSTLTCTSIVPYSCTHLQLIMRQLAFLLIYTYVTVNGVLSITGSLHQFNNTIHER